MQTSAQIAHEFGVHDITINYDAAEYQALENFPTEEWFEPMKKIEWTRYGFNF